MKLIIINSVLFLAFRLTAFFMQLNPADLTKWFTLPEGVSEFILQPWAFITYSFVHFSFLHILFNMIWLYMFGRIILKYIHRTGAGTFQQFIDFRQGGLG